MSYKYDESTKNNVLDVHVCYIESCKKDIVDKWKQEYIGLNIQSYCLANNALGNASIINENSLENFGFKLLQDSFLFNNACYYSLSIPSESVLNSEHVVAFMIEHNEKIMCYHDSHGVDMRREVKDFLLKLFPGYKIKIVYTKQQEDVVSKYDSNKNDNSCGWLSLYNLRDMWFEQNGMQDKVCNFNSLSARQDAWRILSEIQETKLEPKTISGTKFIIGSYKKKTAEEIAQYMEEQRKLSEISFKYRLYNEANYEELIDVSVKNAHKKFEKWRNEQILKRNTINNTRF